MTERGVRSRLQRMGGAMSTSLIHDLDALSGERAYRAYRLNRTGGIEGVVFIEAASDDDARSLAAVIANKHGIDLWERARFLGCFPALSAIALAAISGGPSQLDQDHVEQYTKPEAITVVKALASLVTEGFDLQELTPEIRHPRGSVLGPRRPMSRREKIWRD